jgi:hypothetical protein
VRPDRQRLRAHSRSLALSFLNVINHFRISRPDLPILVCYTCIQEQLGMPAIPRHVRLKAPTSAAFPPPKACDASFQISTPDASQNSHYSPQPAETEEVKTHTKKQAQPCTMRHTGPRAPAAAAHFNTAYSTILHMSVPGFFATVSLSPLSAVAFHLLLRYPRYSEHEHGLPIALRDRSFPTVGRGAPHDGCS